MSSMHPARRWCGSRDVTIRCGSRSVRKTARFPCTRRYRHARSPVRGSALPASGRESRRKAKLYEVPFAPSTSYVRFLPGHRAGLPALAPVVGTHRLGFGRDGGRFGSAGISIFWRGSRDGPRWRKRRFYSTASLGVSGLRAWARTVCSIWQPATGMGEDGTDSDVDLLVRFDKGATLLDQAGRYAAYSV